MGRCAYCGDSATDREHVTPRAYLNTIRSVDPLVSTEIVHACGDCNRLAGAKVFPDFDAKRAYIRERLRRRHAELLRSPAWTDDELAELGYGLRIHIESKEALRAHVLQILGDMGRPEVTPGFSFMLGLAHHDFPDDVKELREIIARGLGASPRVPLDHTHLPEALRARIVALYGA